MKLMRAGVGAVLLWASAVPTVSAQLGDTIKPFVYARVTQDDNVFRSESNPVDDVISRLGVGIEADVPVSRQRFVANGRLDNAIYRDNDQLDHRDAEANLLWNWAVAERWTGDLGYRYFDTIASFEEGGTRTRKDRTDTRAYGTADYLVTPDWDVVAGYSAATHRVAQDRSVDNDTTVIEGELRYAVGPRTKLGLRAAQSYSDFLYLENVNGVFVDNDYRQRDFGLTALWESTAKSRFTGRLGHFEVVHDVKSQDDFSGRSYRLDYHWLVTGVTDINFAAWQDATTRNEVAGVVESQGFEIKPTWVATSKLRFVFFWSYEQVNYKGEANRITPGGPLREDKLERLSLTGNYAISRLFTVSLAYAGSNRDSNKDNSGYRFNTYSAVLRLNF